MSTSRKIDITTNGFQVTVTPTDGLNAIIHKIAVFLDGISFYTKNSAEQSVPAELASVVEKLTQTNERCAGQAFQAIADAGLDHKMQHILVQETAGAHVHLKACDLVTPEDLYDVLKQLVHLQDANARLLPPQIPSNIASMYDIGFRQNEKRIRAGYASYHSDIQSQRSDILEGSAVGKVAAQAGMSLAAGFVIGAFMETLRKKGLSFKSADLVVDGLILMYAYATGSADTFLKVALITGAMRALNAAGVGTSRITRTATSLAVLALLDESVLSVSGFLNYILNMSASVLGHISANALLADKSTPVAGCADPLPAANKASAIQNKLKLHPPVQNTENKNFAGLKRGFLLK